MIRKTRLPIAAVLTLILSCNLLFVDAFAWAVDDSTIPSTGPNGAEVITGGSNASGDITNGDDNPNANPGEGQTDSSDDQEIDVDDSMGSDTEQTDSDDQTAEGEDSDSAEEEEATDLDAEAAEQTPRISVLTHVQRVGWASSWVSDGSAAGSTGKGLRMEAIRLRVDGQGSLKGAVQYRSHVQKEGWQGWVNGDAVSGSEGKGRRVEAIQIRLTDELERDYDVWYRVHAQKMGWMGWARNGETAGTAGNALRLEAIQVVLVAKDGQRPSDAGQNTAVAFVGSECVGVSAHVQKIGWMAKTGNGQVAGTSGRGLRMEAIRASLDGARVPGGVETSTHCQKVGWTGWSGNGQVSGTAGRGLRMEALKMRLTGEAASTYDLYYRVHVQKIGWLAWAREGEAAGSEGLALRAEAIQTMLVPEGAAAPSNDGAGYSLPCMSSLSVGVSTNVSNAWQEYAWNGSTSGTTGQKLCISGVKAYLSGSNVDAMGSLSYRVHVSRGDWQGWVSNGEEAYVDGNVDAVQFNLSGPMTKVYDVYYRAHAQSYGWMGWAKNGQSAGTTGLDKRLEAIQVKLVPKTSKAPGTTYGAFMQGALGYQAEKIEKYLATAIAIANDNSHGYSQGLSLRWGPDYDCSSLVITSLRSAGLDTGGATYTGDMIPNLSARGWNVMGFTNMNALQRGDILLTPNDHTEFYLGNGMNVRAIMSENGTAFGLTGDQTGNEIGIVPFHNNNGHGWTYVLRLR